MIGISHPSLVFRKYSKLGTTRNWIAVGSRLEGAAFINGVVVRCLHSFFFKKKSHEFISYLTTGKLRHAP